MKKALVLGAGGFIGSHLVNRLKAEGYFVRGADLKLPAYSQSSADEFYITDLSLREDAEFVFSEHDWDEVYQLAADMGGATYINSGEHDASVMSNSVLINVNTAKLCVERKVGRLFFPSSACVYKSANDNATCVESEVYPAFPDNQYGWEKLFSERMYAAHRKQYGLKVRIARFHSIVGPESTWNGGKEKAHSALARKVAESQGTIEVIGDGKQTRTFLYIDDCLDAVRQLIDSDVEEVVNIGSPHLVSINEYLEILKQISGKDFQIKYIDGPTGVRGRECNIDKIKAYLGWEPKISLEESSRRTYNWINSQLR